MGKTEPAFRGPRLKLQRARQHIKELAGQQQEYFDRQPFETFDDIGPNGLQLFKVRLIRDHPDTIDATAADALGNLRSSLDLAVCAAASVRGATNLRNTYFHTAASEEEWLKSVKGRTKAAPQEVVDVMRAYKPWPGGNDILSALARMSAKDKHQSLVQVMLGPNKLHKFFIEVVSPDSTFFTVPPNWDFEKKEGIIGRVDSGVIKLTDIVLAGCIAFGQSEPVAGQPIVPVLEDMADLCEEIIKTIEAVVAPAAAR